MNLKQLNYILVPSTRSDRKKFWQSYLGKLVYPSYRLYLILSKEGRFLLVFCMLAGIAGLDLERNHLYILWAYSFSPLLASFCLRFFSKKPKLATELQTPKRLTQGSKAFIHLYIKNMSQTAEHSLRVQKAMLPWDGKWEGKSPVVPILEPGQEQILDYELSFLERGRHEIDSFFVGKMLPLGLLFGSLQEVHSKSFLVVPKIAPVKSIQLPIGNRYQQGGVALASKIGEASELIGLRPYRPGDRVRDLHVRGWARRGEAVVREYQQEYFSRVGLIVDSQNPNTSEAEHEALISLAAGVVAHLANNESLVDVLVSGGEVHPLTIGRGLGCIDQALDHLAVVKKQEGMPANELLSQLSPYFGRLSCIILLSCQWSPMQSELWEALEQTGLAVKRVIVAEKDLDNYGLDQLRPSEVFEANGVQL